MQPTEFKKYVWVISQLIIIDRGWEIPFLPHPYRSILSFTTPRASRGHVFVVIIDHAADCIAWFRFQVIDFHWSKSLGRSADGKVTNLTKKCDRPRMVQLKL